MSRLLQDALLGVVRLIVGVHGRHGATPLTGRQTIYFANHASNIDALAILAALPARVRECTRPVAARDYWDASPVRRFIARRVLGVVFVERHRETDADPLRLVKAALAAGQSLILFPEGTRSLSGEIAPFKSGLYWLSRQFPGVALTPVYLSNLARAMPKGRVLPVPISCLASFGDEIPRAADSDGDAGRAAFLVRAREAVLHLQNAAKG